MDSTAVHIKVHGLVQGVWYRGTAQDRARELNLKGWVRNCDDCTVEIHAEGSSENLDRFVEWCRVGPPAAVVKKLSVKSASPEGFDSFDIR